MVQHLSVTGALTHMLMAKTAYLLWANSPKAVVPNLFPLAAHSFSVENNAAHLSPGIYIHTHTFTKKHSSTKDR